MSNNGSINDALDKAQRGLLDFFFPRKCPFCGRVAGRELLCEACKASLPRCDKVRTGTFGECAAPLYYEGRVRDALLAFKFKRRIEDLNAYGVLMAEKAAEVYADRFDAVTWVPVSKQRLKKRGFDQSRMLCASLCVDWHTEPQETLRKVRDNPAQSGIGDPDAIAGKRFLLIDDIITTGATLTECVRVLKAAGAADVVCLTLAMARDN